MQSNDEPSIDTKIIKRAFRIPILGPWLKHANAYVWQGSSLYTQKLAPFSKWWNSILADIIFAVFITSAVEFIICHFNLLEINYGALIKDFFPSFIGFAIGVYALTYILPSAISSDSLQSNKQKYEALPSNLGYPIISIICMLLISVLLTAFSPSKLINAIQAFQLIYGFMLMIEITSLVTTIGRAQVSQRLITTKAQKNRENSERDGS